MIVDGLSRRDKILHSEWSLPGKNLLLISYLPGFSKDISKANISQWIKGLIKYCCNEADDENLQLAGEKAHDVRALSASLSGS